ncbi:hypothetical protein ACFV1N_46970 [Streptosporangium canum]|uniref:hypothetical protein n=1 Tax=Streptosporangium canum TaxID=324952 RepID=UPI0036CE0763
MPLRKRSRKVPRPRTYTPGERVQLRGAYGVTGHVLKVIYRNSPPFFGYLLTVGGKEVEVAGRDVVDPPRPLLEEWRTWCADDLGYEYVALLDDARLAQLQREWTEANPVLARDYPRYMPRRIEGVEPVHRAKIVKTTERYETWSSNGAHLRVRHRHSWWLRCPCGLHEVVESSHAAKTRKAEHDTPLGQDPEQPGSDP